MECLHCRGEMRRGTAPFHIDRHGYHIQWDEIPAWVCSQCGEPYFEPKEVDRIQGAVLLLDQESQKLQVAG
jgi:YgiT-type zinc finger domain-containing protein